MIQFRGKAMWQMLELFWLCFWRTWSTSLYVKLLDQVILDSIILFFFFLSQQIISPQHWPGTLEEWSALRAGSGWLRGASGSRPRPVLRCRWSWRLTPTWGRVPRRCTARRAAGQSAGWRAAAWAAAVVCWARPEWRAASARGRRRCAWSGRRWGSGWTAPARSRSAAGWARCAVCARWPTACARWRRPRSLRRSWETRAPGPWCCSWLRPGPGQHIHARVHAHTHGRCGLEISKLCQGELRVHSGDGHLCGGGGCFRRRRSPVLVVCVLTPETSQSSHENLKPVPETSSSPSWPQSKHPQLNGIQEKFVRKNASKNEPQYIPVNNRSPRI